VSRAQAYFSISQGRVSCAFDFKLRRRFDDPLPPSSFNFFPMSDLSSNTRAHLISGHNGFILPMSSGAFGNTQGRGGSSPCRRSGDPMLGSAILSASQIVAPFLCREVRTSMPSFFQRRLAQARSITGAAVVFEEKRAGHLERKRWAAGAFVDATGIISSAQRLNAGDDQRKRTQRPKCQDAPEPGLEHRSATTRRFGKAEGLELRTGVASTARRPHLHHRGARGVRWRSTSARAKTGFTSISSRITHQSPPIEWVGGVLDCFANACRFLLVLRTGRAAPGHGDRDQRRLRGPTASNNRNATQRTRHRGRNRQCLRRADDLEYAIARIRSHYSVRRASTKSKASSHDGRARYREIHPGAPALLAPPDGIAATFCCCTHVNRGVFQGDRQLGHILKQENAAPAPTSKQGFDHPIIPPLPGTEYLKVPLRTGTGTPDKTHAFPDSLDPQMVTACASPGPCSGPNGVSASLFVARIAASGRRSAFPFRARVDSSPATSCRYDALFIIWASVPLYFPIVGTCSSCTQPVSAFRFLLS